MPARPPQEPMTRVRARLIAIASFACIALAAGCGMPQPPPQPESMTPATPATQSPTYDALDLDISIYADGVHPSGKTYTLDQGDTVVLVSRSDHDVWLTVRGAGLDKRVFVDSLAAITTSFVVDQPGVVTIETEDPSIVVATLTVS